jgi:hypothetical protein
MPAEKKDRGYVRPGLGLSVKAFKYIPENDILVFGGVVQVGARPAVVTVA